MSMLITPFAADPGGAGASVALYGWTLARPADYITPGGSTLSGLNLLSVQHSNTTAFNKSPVSAGGTSWAPGTWSRIVQSTVGNYMCGAGIKTDGSLWTWGQQNNNFELGQSIGTNQYASSEPKQVGASSWAMVANGGGTMLAIDSVGRLFGWGENGNGQIGDGTTVAKSSPVQIGASSWAMIAAAGTFSAGIRAGDGALFTWGFNGGGQLGDSTTVQKSSPVKIGSSSWNFLSISEANNGFVLAIRIDGGLFTWGDNVGGQLANGNTTSRSSPVQVGTSSWNFVSAGGRNGAGLTVTKELFTWGDNSSGQLGDGTTTNRSSPVKIGTSSWSMVSICGIDASISGCHAIDSVGRLFGWGDNSRGQVGDNTTTNRSSPVQVGSDSWAWVHTNHLVTNWGTGDLAAGGGVLGIKADGTVWHWGGLNFDSLPTYDVFLSDGNGGQLSWAFAGVKKIAMSDAGSVLVIDSADKLWAWGDNQAGQLGDGTTTNRSSPVQIGSLAWKDIFLGGIGPTQFALGLLADGSLYAWGANASGQLGDGTTTARSSPVHIGSSSWSMVCSGGQGTITGTDNGPHAAAIRTDGGLFTWGANTNGQLGDGSTTAKSSPVKIGSSSWAMISIGGGNQDGYFSLGIDAVGRLLTWGANTRGQMADGTATGKSSPVVIGTSSWSMVHAGPRFCGGILVTTGALYTWGFNNVGQLGDGTVTSRSSPVHIGTSSWTMVYARGLGMLGKTTANQLFGWGTGWQPHFIPTATSSPVAIGSAQNWTQIQGTLMNANNIPVVIGIR